MPSIVTSASLAGTLMLAALDSARPSPESVKVGAFDVPVLVEVTISRYVLPSYRTEALTPAFASLIFDAMVSSVSVLPHVIDTGVAVPLEMVTPPVPACRRSRSQTCATTPPGPVPFAAHAPDGWSPSRRRRR